LRRLPIAKHFPTALKLRVTLEILVSDCVNFCAAGLRSRTALAAENLFLRKQLALFQEREKRAVPTTAADRFVLSKLARFFDWCSVLVIVKPATLIGWHRAAFRRFWRWKSKPVGRPPVSAEVRRLIRRMSAENLTWGEERIADELWLKLQIRLSPRTVENTLGNRRTGVAEESALVDLSPEPCTGYCSLRLLRFRDGSLPYPLYIRCP
jgi:hypothetical protein